MNSDSGLVAYDSSSTSEEESDHETDANGCDTKMKSEDDQYNSSITNQKSNKIPSAVKALSEFGTESSFASPQGEHYEDIYREHNLQIQRREAFKRQHQSTEERVEEDLHPADTIAYSSNKSVGNANQSSGKEETKAKQRRIIIPEAAQQASIASAYKYKTEDQQKKSETNKVQIQSGSKSSLAKERVKGQRLKGQSGIGEDFKTWRSEEEMRLRQTFD